MGAREKVIREIETLKTDTNRVIRDLTVLSSSLADSASTEVSKGLNSTQQALQNELKRIRIRLGKLNRLLADNAKKVHQHVHTNPYPWVAGALGTGIVAGSILRRRNKQS